MTQHHAKDEHLERLWHISEEGKNSLTDLKESLGHEFNDAVVEELVREGLLERDSQGRTVGLTKRGEEQARKLIRAHRLAERMVHDVLGGDFESGACEFEHTINPDLVDSICILLGHPRECPHGLPIPEGECCRTSAKVAQSSVMPLTELPVGHCARIAYAYSKNDQQLHKMNGMHLRPGVTVKMHQTFPSYVIECEGGNIALDENVAANICVWRGPNTCPVPPGQAQASSDAGEGKGFGLRFRKRFGRRN